MNSVREAAARIRALARSGQLQISTTGLAPAVQANLLVLPNRYTSDFILFCRRNPVPCPLLAVVTSSTNFSTDLAPGSDIRTDLPFYNVYNSGELIHSSVQSMEEFWSDDYTGFLIGCSFSFESAVSMFTTTVPLLPSGVFTKGHMVVSMRPYKWRDISLVRDITRLYHTQHGEPVAWGWEGAKQLGVEDKVRNGAPDWGDWIDGLVWADDDGDNGSDGVVPVFWGCGVTPQQVVIECSNLIEGNVMSHKPGFMFVTDIPEEDYSFDFGR